MTEQKFGQTLRKRLRPVGFQVTPIEATTALGVPDMYFSFTVPSHSIQWSGEGWIELKILEGNAFRHPLSENQIAWIRLQVANRVNVAVMAYDMRDDSIWMWDGVDVVDLAFADRAKKTRAVDCIVNAGGRGKWKEMESAIVEWGTH